MTDRFLTEEEKAELRTRIEKWRGPFSDEMLIDVRCREALALLDENAALAEKLDGFTLRAEIAALTKERDELLMLTTGMREGARLAGEEARALRADFERAIDLATAGFTIHSEPNLRWINEARRRWAGGGT